MDPVCHPSSSGEELAEALIVSGDDLDEYPEDDLPDSWQDGFVDEEYVKEMIIGRCGSLLQLQSSAKDLPLAEHSASTSFTFSVKEYLCNLSSLTSPSAQRRRAWSGGCTDRRNRALQHLPAYLR